MQKLKDKEKFLHEAKDLPETAKDLYGRVHAPKETISKDESKTEDKKEPDVPEDLPGEDVKLEVPDYEEEIKPLKQSEPEKIPEKKSEEPKKIVEEPPEISEVKPSKVETPKLEKPIPRSLGDEGFFNDFHNLIISKKLDEDLLSELIDKDYLHKMREFHSSRNDDSPFFFRKADGELALEQLLFDLRRLEEEWFIRHSNFKEADLLLQEKESEIDLKIQDLNGLLRHLKQKEVFERKAEKKHYFYLFNGSLIRSIGELREALKTMDRDVFKHHVNSKKNDFASWILNVFSEEELAAKVKHLISQKDFLKALNEF